MRRLTEKHFYKYIKCPSWVYFDAHETEQKLIPPLMENLAADGMIKEAHKKILKSKKGVDVKIKDLDEAFLKTLELMKSGEQTIFHGVLIDGHWVGRPDMLEKVEGRSDLGDYYYVACDIKRSRSIREEYKFQGAFYAELLNRIQGRRPYQGYIMTPESKVLPYLLEEFLAKFHLTLHEIEKILSGKKPAHFLSSGCKQSPWFPKCKIESESCDDLSLVNRIWHEDVVLLKKAGVFSVSDLIKTSAVKMAKKTKISESRLEFLIKQSQALKSGKHIVVSPINFPESKTEFYFDIEADPLRDIDYLFGVLKVDGGSVFHPFLSDGPDGEEKAFRDFIDFVSKEEAAPIYHYGGYEVEVLERLAKKYEIPDETLKNITKRMIDILDLLRKSVIFPLYFYSLKDIAQFLKFKWRAKDASGLNSILWYEEWLKTGDKKILEDIVNYNEDDVRATLHLKLWAERELI